MRILLTLPVALLMTGCGGGEAAEPGGGSPATGSTERPAGSAAPTSGARTVKIADFKFGAPLTVSRGTTVTWENADSAPHNAVGEDFKTNDLRQGQSDSVTFSTAGSFDYVCTFHPFMKSTVVVR